MNYSKYLSDVISIAKSAGDAILTIYNQAEIGVETKGDGSPLTMADQRAHNLISEALVEFTPDIPVLSEESVDEVGGERLHWPIYWLVDPLDGTKEFIKRNGEFTVNIALIDRGKPVLGVVYVPVTHVCYSGVVGQGASKQEGDTPTNPIKVRACAADHVTMVASRSHLSEPVRLFQTNLEATFSKVEAISMGSSLKLCLVAEGQADIYPRLGPTSEWDTAAAQAVVEAAGGQVLACDLNPLRYSKENILNPWFLVIGDASRGWCCEGLYVEDRL